MKLFWGSYPLLTTEGRLGVVEAGHRQDRSLAHATGQGTEGHLPAPVVRIYPLDVGD